MNQFNVDDYVEMPGVPFIVIVLETGMCTDPGCVRSTFRFVDPESGEDDWMHQDEFRLVES